MDDSMPPKPDCEFDFSLPHGIDDEEDIASNDHSTRYTQDPQADNASQSHQGSTNCLLDDNKTSGAALAGGEQRHVQQTTEYEFPAGFSDDEGGEEAFDRSRTSHQARKASPKQKKSPRRSDDGNGDDEATPKPKKPRKSLFGGPLEHVDEQAPENIENEVRQNAQDQDMEDHIDEDGEDTNLPNVSRLDIRQRMSSLNIDLQEEQDNRPFSLGFGIATSERGSRSPDPFRAASEESVTIPKEVVYDLRQNIARSRPFTYLDSDKTGNYDPAQEARLKMLRLQKAKAAKAAKKKGKGKAKAKEPKEHVLKCIVRLRIKAFGNVRNLTDDLEHWPEGWSDVDSDYEEDTKEIRKFYRHNTPSIDPQIAIEDPKGEVDDLTGRPAARGCKHCQKHDQDCSMAEGGAYPCEQCEDDEIDCIPCMPTKVKGGCRQCLEDGQESCSFEDNPDQLDCEHCIEHEYTCEPLPPRGYKKPRDSYDSIMYSSNRKHVQCTFCRIEKKRCSLKEKTDKPPCKFCKKNGIGCTFYDIPKLERANKAAGKNKAKPGPTDGDAPEVSKPGSEFFSPEDLEDIMMGEDSPLSREVTPEIEMEDEAGNKGPLTKIRTSFAHPIKFDADTSESTECSFCEIPAFGFFGHLERDVHVIQWYNGLGYTETGGGWAEEKGTTTMCKACTLARLQVIVCPGHTFDSIDDVVASADVLTDLLLAAQPGSPDMHRQMQRWCSLCFTPASYGCCTSQPSLTFSDDEEMKGCGLRLCDKCFEKLRDDHVWNFEEMTLGMDVCMPKTTEEDEKTGNLEDKVRADVGFLREDGLLMRNVNAEGGEDMEE